MAAVILGNPATFSTSYTGSVVVPSSIPIGSNPISRGNTVVPTWYTKTQLQTSGQSEVHWDNLTNVPDYQPLDADLTSIAGLGFASTSFLKKTAANTWALDTNTYLTAETDPIWVEDREYWYNAESAGRLWGGIITDAGGDKVQRVGVATHADRILVMPSLDVITVA